MFKKRKTWPCGDEESATAPGNVVEHVLLAFCEVLVSMALLPHSSSDLQHAAVRYGLSLLLASPWALFARSHHPLPSLSLVVTFSPTYNCAALCCIVFWPPSPFLYPNTTSKQRTAPPQCPLPQHRPACCAAASCQPAASPYHLQ